MKQVTITIDIDDDLLLKLALMAHERRITLNALIVKLLNKHIKRTKRK
jgi:predicted HicB family RNase H-like nuclease